LADRALQVCSNLRLEFAIGACLAFRAAAEIGLNHLSQARRTLLRLQNSSVCREDPYFRVVEQTLQAKLALARRAPDEALKTLDQISQDEAPRRALGEYFALLTIGHAIRDDLDAVILRGAEAQQLTHSVEAVFYPRYAQLIVALRKRPLEYPDALRNRMRDLIRETAEAEFLDAFIVAYRAEPALLTLIRGSSSATRVAQRAMRSARDYGLARSAGVEAGAQDGDGRLEALTHREREVLELMCEGLSNAQLATRLFITESTVKVHVHNILTKLGVRTRLQAVLFATSFGHDEKSGAS
jgi:DNA-binding NarL/FixJ family response regulator